MISTFALSMLVIAAEPTEKQLALLKVFRSEFVPITPGKDGFPESFVMGDNNEKSQSPARRVTFDYEFQIARYEVPQDLWQAVTGKNPSRWKGPRNSVEMLSYDEAVGFCRKVTELLRKAKLINPDEIVRLPSEAEWEYTARAGSKTKYSFGDDAAKLGAYGWFHGNAAGNDPPVGAKKPNAWKLYDVHGYLWEWCADRWHDNYKGAPADGSAWMTGGDAKAAVLRGGSWKDPAAKLATRYRRSAPRGLRDDAVGLRCVLAKEKP